jgi:hypothetical protein
LILRDGHFIATRQSRRVEFLEEGDDPTRAEMTRALTRGRRELVASW